LFSYHTIFLGSITCPGSKGIISVSAQPKHPCEKGAKIDGLHSNTQSGKTINRKDAENAKIYNPI
jgi:hypothetical protein